MKRKTWLLVLLVLIVIGQFTVLSSFFHSFQTQGFAQNYSIVEISKLNYAYGWASIDIHGLSPEYPVTLQFSNGTQITLSSDYTFKMNFPRTGDFWGNAGTNLPETNVYINESQPIEAAILSNASSFETSYLTPSGTYFQGMFDIYWFTIQGSAFVTITGYGASY